jgi:hypothetical protein
MFSMFGDIKEKSGMTDDEQAKRIGLYGNETGGIQFGKKKKAQDMYRAKLQSDAIGIISNIE